MVDRFVSLAWLLALGLLLGCDGGKSGPARAAVSGHVTLDGQDIQQGSIGFFPTGGTSGMTAGGPIQDGKFSLPAERGPVVGNNRVEIHATKKSGKRVPAAFGQPGQMDDELVEAVPAEFNTKSKLERTLKAGDNKDLNFELSTK